MALHSNSHAVRKSRLVILISGRGSNMQAIHAACESGELHASVALVVSNKDDAPGLDYTRKNNIKSIVIDHRDFPDRSQFERTLIEAINPVHADLVLLAGFMRRLTAEFINHYQARIINIHPSILPRHPGLDTHARVLDCPDRWHGCSVHFVTEELDGGPVIGRSIVPVKSADTAESLAARVLTKEHKLYTFATQLCISGKLQWQNGHLLYCGKRLRYPILLQ